MAKKKAKAKTQTATPKRKRASVTNRGVSEKSNTSEQPRVWHLREIEALILQMRTDGASPDAIVKHLHQRNIRSYLNKKGDQIQIVPQTVSTTTNQALTSGRLRYVPAIDEELQGKIFGNNPTLRMENIHVVQTALGKSIAKKGAEELLRIMLLHKEGADSDRDNIRIGFFGGKTPSDLMLFLAEEFSKLEKPREMERFPRRITFISMVGSFPTSKIAVDPNAYFTLFLTQLPEDHSYFDFQFVSLPATGLLTPDEHKAISKFRVVQEAIDKRSEIDVIVGSCGHWGEGHHSTYDYVQSACGEKLEGLWQDTIQQLDANNIIGDFCWSPINADGPIARETLPLRMFTAMDFDQIVKFVHPPKRSERTDGKLLLLVSPCYGKKCNKTTKGKVLEAILHASPTPPVTHLVTDSASAREYCERFHDSNRPLFS